MIMTCFDQSLKYLPLTEADKITGTLQLKIPLHWTSLILLHTLNAREKSIDSCRYTFDQIGSTEMAWLLLPNFRDASVH